MWFAREIELYSKERETWGNLGFSVDQEILKEKGQIVFKGKIPNEGEEYDFEIRYPEGYPYIAPSVKCTSVEFQKHQTPVSQTICWHEEWKNYGIVGAKDIIPQLQKWLRGIKHGFNPNEESEDIIPAYYEAISSREAIIITPTKIYENWTEEHGRFEMRVQFRNELIQAELTKIKSEKSEYESEHKIYPNGEMYKGICFNVDQEPPFFKEQKTLLEWLEEKVGVSDIKEICRTESIKNPDLGPILGIRYPRNGSYHFLVVALETMQFSENATHVKYFQMVVFESEILSSEHLFKRVSNLQPLQNKHVVIVGLGAIGSPVAVELAKAGIRKMTFVDPDRIKAGNVVRHVTNFDHIGMTKVEAVQKVCNKHNPYVRIEMKRDWWGHVNENSVIATLKDADLVVCCVGHSPVERYVNEVTRRMGIPTIYAYSGLGALSGRIFLVEGKESLCYHCHQYAIGELRVPSLKHPDETIMIHEEGCAGPSFLGSGIDTGTIALHTSRFALQTLLKKYGESYEAASYNHMVWHSQNGEGKVEVIQVTVEAKSDCPYCQIKEDVNFGDYVPEARKLIDAAIEIEAVLLYGGTREEAMKEFCEIEQTFKGKTYQDKDGNEVMIERIYLNRQSDPICWEVQYRDKNWNLHNESVDDFFGYELINGYLLPRYQKVLSKEIVVENK